MTCGALAHSCLAEGFRLGLALFYIQTFPATWYGTVTQRRHSDRLPNAVRVKTVTVGHFIPATVSKESSLVPSQRPVEPED